MVNLSMWVLYIEVKLPMHDKAAHERLADLLETLSSGIHLQGNFSFEGAKRELSSQMVVLRLPLLQRRQPLYVKG